MLAYLKGKGMARYKAYDYGPRVKKHRVRSQYRSLKLVRPELVEG